MISELLLEKWPDAPFLIDDDGVHRRCDVARRLIATGDGRETPRRVAVVASSTTEAVLDVLGHLERGNSPIFLHPRFPALVRERVAHAAGVNRPIPPTWPLVSQAAGRHFGALSSTTLDTPCTIFTTSGSTGSPSVVVHRLTAHLAAAVASNTRTPFTVGHRWLLSLPLAHVGGFAVLMRALVGGGAVVIPRARDLSIVHHASRLRADVLAANVTHLSVVATQLHDLLSDAPLANAQDEILVRRVDKGIIERASVEDDQRLHAQLADVLVGGGPIPQVLLEAASLRQLPIRQTYGLTEFCSQVTTSARGAPFDAGLPLDGVDVSLVPTGEGAESPAEIVVCGAGALLGTISSSSCHTILSPPADGFRTGDLGRRTPDAHVEVTGRRGLRFISGGENVQPEEVEAALSPVASVVVVAVPSPRWGQRPVAFVDVGRSLAATNDLATLTALLRKEAERRLPSFARPDAYFAMPDDAGLKPSRRALSELATALISDPTSRPRRRTS